MVDEITRSTVGFHSTLPNCNYSLRDTWTKVRWCDIEQISKTISNKYSRGRQISLNANRLSPIRPSASPGVRCWSNRLLPYHEINLFSYDFILLTDELADDI